MVRIFSGHGSMSCRSTATLPTCMSTRISPVASLNTSGCAGTSSHPLGARVESPVAKCTTALISLSRSACEAPRTTAAIPGLAL